jgi:hypothetical protein
VVGAPIYTHISTVIKRIDLHLGREGLGRAEGKYYDHSKILVKLLTLSSSVPHRSPRSELMRRNVNDITWLRLPPETVSVLRSAERFPTAMIVTLSVFTYESRILIHSTSKIPCSLEKCRKRPYSSENCLKKFGNKYYDFGHYPSSCLFSETLCFER